MNKLTWKIAVAFTVVFLLSVRSATSVGSRTESTPGLNLSPRTIEPADNLQMSKNWLERFNYYRQAAGLPPVVESPVYSAALAKHVNYMLLNVPAEGLWHGETLGRPGYTVEGAQAAAESNLFWFPSGVAYTTPAVAIDGWMGSIHHRFGMLNPDLVTTGFSLGCDQRNCGAGLNVIGGIVWDSNPRPNGVFYPGSNQEGVNTDIVLTWQFGWGPTAVLKSASLKNSSGQPVATTTTSPPSGDYFNMVSVKPNTPLLNDMEYTASVTVQLGTQELSQTWSFTTLTFADVPPDHMFWKYIEAFHDAGITSGCSASPMKFCPLAYVTRGEMAVFLERAMGNFAPTPDPSGMFADVPYDGQPASFQAFIEEFYNDGITTGCSTNPLKYCPQNFVTRGEMAVFIERALGNFAPTPNPTGMFADVPYLGQPEAFTPFIEQFYNDGITTGCAANPLKYCPQNKVTRQEMAVFIVRAFGIPLP